MAFAVAKLGVSRPHQASGRWKVVYAIVVYAAVVLLSLASLPSYAQSTISSASSASSASSPASSTDTTTPTTTPALSPAVTQTESRSVVPTAVSTITSKKQNPGSSRVNKILVKFKSKANPSAISALHANVGVRSQYAAKGVSGLQVIALEPGKKIEDALAAYKNNPMVDYAELDQRLYLRETLPNESLFDQLWGLNNTGQVGGLDDADINAPEAWDITTGNNDVIVAVVDTGVDYSHIDLAANIWLNPGEIPGNGIDDDGNGYVDDIHGIDSGDDDVDPMDEIDHGTHVAGTIGATGDNAEGITGVSWNVKIIACKIFSRRGQQLDAFVSDAIECLDYLYDLKVNRGIDVIATNNSWGWVGTRSQALYEAIVRQADAGILFIASAGNDTINTDEIRDFPSTYYSANLVSIAATDRHDALATFSNRGRHTVHVGAPGVSVLSTIPGGAQFVPPEQNPHSNIFFDDMESGQGEWIADVPWSISNEEAFSGTSSWSDSPGSDYDLGVITTLTSPSIDLTPWSTEPIFIGFYIKYFLEEGFDFVDFQVSSNDGVSWVPLANFTGLNPVWQFFNYQIPSNFYTDSFRFRFSLVSDYIIPADGIYLDDIGIGTSPYVPVQASGSTALSFKSGTSMASPHVTGLLALLKAQDPTRTWSQLKNLVISSGTPIDSLTTNSISGRRIRAADDNGIGALTCSNQTVLARRQPFMDTVVVEQEGSLDVSMLHITCGQPAGSITVTLQETGAVIPLVDDGNGYDQYAGDGIYSAQVNFSGTALSNATLLFPDNSSVNVKLVKNYLPGRIISNQWRDIAAVRNIIFSGDDALHFVDSPFPVEFPGEDVGFDRLVVSSNGNVIPRRIDEFSAIYPYSDNTSFPTLLYQRLVAPYWDDLTAFDMGNLSWGVLGTEPDRELVVEWKDVKHYSHNLDGISFQAVFFEGSTDILFNYQDVEFDNTSVSLDLSNGASASVGIQISQRVSRQFSVDSPQIESNSSMLFSVNNFPPQLAGIGDKTVIEDLDLEFRVSATDNNVIAPVLSISGLPAGAQFNEQSGEFSWPNAGPPGRYPVTITAVDIANPALSASESFIIYVEKNLPPVISPVPDLIIEPGAVLQVPLGVSDPNDTPVYINVMDLPGDAYFDETSRTIFWDSAEQGEYTITIIAVDSINAMLVDFISFTVNVVATGNNEPPILFGINDLSIIEGESIKFTVMAHDTDMTAPLLSVNDLPDGASFNPDNGQFDWRDAGPVGDYEMTFVATDSQDDQLVDQQLVTIHIDTNHAPQIDAIDNIFLLEGEPLDVQVNVSDADNTPVIVNVSGLPDGATFSQATRTIHWDDAVLGQYEIAIVAVDTVKASLIDAEFFSITVVAPVINVPPNIDPFDDESVIEGQPVEIQVKASDGNLTQPVLSVVELPAGAEFNALAGIFKWLQPGPPGIYTVTFIATDAEDPSITVSRDLSIEVVQNLPPIMDTIEDIVVVEGVAIQQPVNVSDPNNTPVIVHVVGLPDGASFNDAPEQMIEWPTSVPGEYTVTIFATDTVNPALASTQSFTITIAPEVSEKGNVDDSKSNKKSSGGGFDLICLLLYLFYLQRLAIRRRACRRLHRLF